MSQSVLKTHPFVYNRNCSLLQDQTRHLSSPFRTNEHTSFGHNTIPFYYSNRCTLCGEQVLYATQIKKNDRMNTTARQRFTAQNKAQACEQMGTCTPVIEIKTVVKV